MLRLRSVKTCTTSNKLPCLLALATCIEAHNSTLRTHKAINRKPSHPKGKATAEQLTCTKVAFLLEVLSTVTLKDWELHKLAETTSIQTKCERTREKSSLPWRVQLNHQLFILIINVSQRATVHHS